jgi:hypothetical protein
MADEIPIGQQASEVRNAALAERSCLTNAAWRKRHERTEWSIPRKREQIAALFAAADTLDRLAADEGRRAAS